MQNTTIKQKLSTLPKISEIIAREKLGAKKSLGQNFLIDETIVRQIVNSAKVSNLPVLEIGPGLGSLTREIIYKGAEEIHLVEKDERFLTQLEMLQKIHPNLTIHHADVMHFNEVSICPKNASGSFGKIQIIANLPYNIGTALILKWLNNKEIFESITVMLQKEVANRIMAQPKTSSYGSLSVFTQILCNVEHIMDVPPHSFQPQPRVESSVIMLRPKLGLEDSVHLESLQKVLKAAFSERRKMVRKTLVPCFGAKLLKVLEKCNIPPTARAEEIEPAKYIMLSGHC